MQASANHYETLGIEPSATLDQVKAAVRRLVREAHPDTGGDAERFRRVIAARDTLTDSRRRARYDHDLQRGFATGAADAPPRQAPDPAHGSPHVYVFRWGQRQRSATPNPVPHTLRGYASELATAFGVIFFIVYAAAFLFVASLLLVLLLVPGALAMRHFAGRSGSGDDR